jgi:hypothetical protein
VPGSALDVAEGFAVAVVFGSRVALRVGETSGVFVVSGVPVAATPVALFVAVGESGVGVSLGSGVAVGDSAIVGTGAVSVTVEVGNDTVAVMVGDGVWVISGDGVEVSSGVEVDVAAGTVVCVGRGVRVAFGVIVAVAVPVGVRVAETIGPGIDVGNGRRVASGGGGVGFPAPVAVGASG